MSYSLSFYSVPAGKLASVLGSGDLSLYDTIRAKRAEDLVSNDEFFEDEEDDEEEESSGGGIFGAIKGLFGKKAEEAPVASGPYPTSEELLRALIVGDPIDSRCGAKVGYVYEILVSELGTREHADSLQGMRSSSNFTGVLDGVLKKGGVDLRNFSIESTLMSRGALIPLPPPDDFPGMGYVLASEINPLDEKLASTAIDEAASRHEWKSDIDNSLKELRKIVSTCKAKELDLFSFYY